MGVNSMYTAASGLTSFSTAMSMVADNIANANTVAFKSSSARFGDLVSGYYATQSTDTDRMGAGSVITGISTNFGQGPLISTNCWSDLAINGSGFFSLKLIDDTGAVVEGAQTYYTRDGSFHLDKNGYLVNLQGYALLNDAGEPIKVDDPASPVYSNYNVTLDGKIQGTPVDPSAGVDPVTIATIRICTFPNQDGLIRQGSNLYLPGPAAGAVIDGTANAGGNGTILDNSIEGSNVDLATEMINMIIYQADYNANSKCITTSSDMLNTVINMVR